MGIRIGQIVHLVQHFIKILEPRLYIGLIDGSTLPGAAAGGLDLSVISVHFDSIPVLLHFLLFTLTLTATSSQPLFFLQGLPSTFRSFTGTLLARSPSGFIV